ncbi:hypothetical protein NKR19_g5137 [Coniochaeta hoffmannii]|uniref:Uncharacterized protein n=1 Tax=Coniochaeta hoffmannii TaxID=91930 RepID=A0AA38S7S2_9PEZI|nr:hypothetical protein NKR19_g5137 [Coniochaeta hoffmannii]
MTYLRRPDMFDMCIYNDFYSYGILEVLENLLLDYVEAEGNWKEQWDVCQTIAWFLLDHSSEPMQMMDDSDRLDATIQLAGRVFLSMLALLGTKDLFTPTSQIKDFGLVMALNMKAGRSYRDDISLLQGQSQAARFDNHVLAYAKKHFVPLVGASDIDDIATACNGAVKLPVAMQTKPDPASKSVKIGGDKYDIMAMSSAERKGHSFDKKDPLGKREIGALKMVPMRA